MSPDKEIDLRDRLRFAAGSLAADFGDQLTTDRAEELVFSSAEGLLASASVTEFVPVLAERRARLTVRSGLPVPPVLLAEPAATPVPPTPPPMTPNPTLPPEPTAPPAPPLLAIPSDEVARLRAGVACLREQVAGYLSTVTSR